MGHTLDMRSAATGCAPVHVRHFDVVRATTTGRPAVETIELSSIAKRADGAAMSNLALNLVASAARIPERTAAITDEHAMTYAELDAASARLATLLEREGTKRGRSGRRDAAEYRRSTDRLLRHLAARRHRGADEPADAGPRGAVLPVEHRRQGADRKPGICRCSHRRRRERRCEAVALRRRRAVTVDRRLTRVRQPRRACRLRHRRRAAHLGNHRHAEGCRADPRKPRLEPGSHRATPCEADR